MATKGKRIYIDLSGADPVVAGDEEDDPRQREAESTLQGFLDEYAGGSHKISLFKVRPGTADLDWLAHYPPEQLSPELIRDEWGPGSYSLTLLDARGHFITRRKFHIGGTPQQWERARNLAKGIDTSSGGNGGGADALKIQLEMMRQMHETNLAMIQAQSNRGGNFEDIVKAFVALRENTSKPGEQLAFLTQVIGLAKTLNGNQDNSVVGLIREVAPAILEQIPAVAAAAQGRQLPPAPANGSNGKAPQLPPVKEFQPGGAGKPAEAASPAAETAAAGNPAPDQNADTMRLILARLHYWKAKARDGHNADFWIDYVFQNPDEPDIAAVLWAVRHYSYASIVQLDPDIESDERLRKFFLELYDGIRAELLNSDDPTGDGGDSSDAPTDAGADRGEPAPADSTGDGDRAPQTEPAAQPA